jgi:FtsP/CotA-like multicopper oxidase with cupredoxin domain
LSRTRLLVVGVALVLFAVAGGVLIYATGNHSAQNVTIDLTVTGAKSMSPSEVSAHQNDTVTINVRSDTDGEVHLHGYDIPFDAKAGQVVSKTFKAVNTCTCEIEWESTSTRLGDLTVSP